MGLSPSSTRLLELLADGDWHDRDRLVDITAPLIEPGRAFRKAEYERTHRRPTASPTRVIGDDTTSLRTGARRIATHRIHDFVRSGRLEQRTIDGRVEIRAAQ